jgi:hypothetical protein
LPLFVVKRLPKPFNNIRYYLLSKVKIASGHLDLSGSLHEFQWIAVIHSFEIKKSKAEMTLL